MKKRITSVLLLIALVLSLLIGCSNNYVAHISLDEIPEYSGNAYVVVNGNVPFFEDKEKTLTPFEEYSYLDALGRCGVAFALIGIETMPTEEREEISSVSPSGWKYNKVSNNNQYDFVDGTYIYNRCHLIGFQLAGENANEKNLITGTRYLNIEGMLPFENQIADYVKATKNHVLFRVTPIFDQENLVASGVLMEAYSMEDNGEGIEFCVYAYNVQPGVKINYFTGQNVPSGEELPPIEESTDNYTPDYYVINTKSKKIHSSECPLASKIAEENRQKFEGNEKALGEEYPGYSGCGSCLPNLVIPTSPDPTEDESDIEDVPADTTVGGDCRFVLNISKSSKKYHLPSCSYLPSGDNRVDYYNDLATLMSEYPDFTPCKSCKPDTNSP